MSCGGGGEGGCSPWPTVLGPVNYVVRLINAKIIIAYIYSPVKKVIRLRINCNINTLRCLAS